MIIDITQQKLQKMNIGITSLLTNLDEMKTTTPVMNKILRSFERLLIDLVLANEFVMSRQESAFMSNRTQCISATVAADSRGKLRYSGSI